ncbi:MAG: M48 family metallopeptidase [Candidatus Omnitrophica bacterium]|nr:M48 family metallopeptidase [Candidatus Omnitrophota bacterium]
MPVPNESAQVRELERVISAYQARDLERQGVRVVQPGERLAGFDLQQIVDRLSRVTERPSLHYRVWLLNGRDPNAVALADGRVYITTGMLDYLASRGSRESELAFILGHEIGHTVAQHLVQRVEQLQRQQMMLDVVGLGASLAAQRGGAQAQQLGELASQAASLISQVIESGYSQQQELEADQLGIRYCLRAGYDPKAALALLEDFSRFDIGGPFLRSHPYSERRRQDLERYLAESGVPLASTSSMSPALRRTATPSSGAIAERRWRLLEAQQLYPVGSQSWKNIQRQLDALERQATR